MSYTFINHDRRRHRYIQRRNLPCHRDADPIVGQIKHGLRYALVLRAHYNGTRSCHIGIIHQPVDLLCGSYELEPALFKIVGSYLEIRNLASVESHKRSCRGLDRIGVDCRTSFGRNDDTVSSGTFQRPGDRTEVAYIAYTVENDENRVFARGQSIVYQILYVYVVDLRYIGNDSLMRSSYCTVETLRRYELEVYAFFSKKAQEFPELVTLESFF